MKKCKICGQLIPEGRLKILPHTTTCTTHSTAEKKVGTPIGVGVGEEIHTELNIMEAEDFKRLQRLSKRELNTL